MNLSDMTTFVRTHADTDATDAPDSTLTVYARAAYNDIKRRLPQWNDRHSSDTLTSTAGTAGYPLTSSAFSGQNLEYVTRVVGPSDVLVKIDWPTYIDLLDGPDVVYTTNEAVYYTVDAGSLYLWPTPSASNVEYTVYGYTVFTDWPAGAAEPDMPREFDEAICWYMLSKYYLAQEDIELAQLYMQDYERVVSRQLAAMMRVDQPRTRVLGGKKNRGLLRYSDWVKRMVEG